MEEDKELDSDNLNEEEKKYFEIVREAMIKKMDKEIIEAINLHNDILDVIYKEYKD